jgi:hypothetical protein
MPEVTVEDGGVAIGRLKIPIDEFTILVERHLDRAPGTRDLEATGWELVTRGFPEADLENFVRNVCIWGGYPGIAGRILKNNHLGTIRVAFLNASEVLDSNMPDTAAALRSVNQIHTLGQVSFASKHLRFLWPNACPVLDSVISSSLGYSMTTTGYSQFCRDCSQISETLRNLGMVNPMQREEDGWFAADVEMALFAGLNGW